LNGASRDSYFYDRTYQVTGADYGVRLANPAVKSSGIPRSLERFGYDPVGNRTTSARSSFTSQLLTTNYSTNTLNQYTLIGDFVPTHDRNGNLASLRGWTYRYDAMNRLVEARSATMTARFYYDAKNRCVARSYNGAVTLNYYDNWNLIEERTPAGVQQARYVHGRRIDEIVVMVNKYGVFYPNYDVLGNVTMLTDPVGKLVERYSYSVTGQVDIFDSAGTVQNGSVVGNRWMFTGREWLAEVGFFDYRTRNYSPVTGRFLQTDSIRFSATDINLYRYCKNAFVNLFDPYGEDPPQTPTVTIETSPGVFVTMSVDTYFDAYTNSNGQVDYNAYQARITEEFNKLLFLEINLALLYCNIPRTISAAILFIQFFWE